VTIAVDSEKITGTAQAVDEEGALMICDRMGNLRRVIAGDLVA
jgi:biotin-(acetyl-CoA carboxylase) ligase